MVKQSKQEDRVPAEVRAGTGHFEAEICDYDFGERLEPACVVTAKIPLHSLNSSHLLLFRLLEKIVNEGQGL